MLSTKHSRTLGLVFTDPAPANIKWARIEGLLKALGATVTEGSGSRVRVDLDKHSAVFHRPHPSPEAKPSTAKSVRRFLNTVGVET